MQIWVGFVRRVGMRVYISVDMEGISGLVRWMDVSSNGIDFAANRIAMTLDANAAIDGLQRIVFEDGVR